MINYSVIRSKRKTLAIHITKEANVEVRAPLTIPQEKIERFVKEKENWILKHLQAQEARLRQREAFYLDYGHSVRFLGESVLVLVRKGNKAGYDGDYFYLPPNLTPDEIKKAVIQIYKVWAKQILQEKVLQYAQKMAVQPSRVTITNARTRWGSCSRKKNISFSWRLIMADDAVVDYVIVHELAHIREHNHSGKFWSIVASILPDYKGSQAKLRELEKQLALEAWN